MADDSFFYKNLLDNLYDGVYFVDTSRKITYWNAGAEKITGYSAPEVLDKSCADNILMHINEGGENLCRGSCPVAQTLTDAQVREAEVYLHHKDGQRIPVLVRVSPIRNADGHIVGAVEVFSENTARVSARQHIEELQKMALLDPLTQVGNRRNAEKVLYDKVQELQRYNWRSGVLLIDIDRFKQINDTHGHDTGDRVLHMVAQTLARNIRSFDSANRWGGEEFVITVTNITEEQLQKTAQKLLMLVENSQLAVGAESLHVTVSIGATMLVPGDTVETVVKRADQLMYRSKELGRNKVTFG